MELRKREAEGDVLDEDGVACSISRSNEDENTVDIEGNMLPFHDAVVQSLCICTAAVML